MNNYPNPCDTCTKVCRRGYGCLGWKIRYLFRQKQINGYAKKHGITPGYPESNKFQYEHPDILRGKTKRNPCKGCAHEETCDIPCEARLKWWDDQMAQLGETLGRRTGEGV